VVSPPCTATPLPDDHQQRRSGEILMLTAANASTERVAGPRSAPTTRPKFRL
jgi:hypothetical protein